jgi:dGTPase
MAADRNARFYPSAAAANDPGDARTPSQKDHDRILYTSAFRRLAGVTQVVGALEGHVFHNRLTHTLEVAQIARRLAERLREQHRAPLEKHHLQVDPEVAEAAALAHDLGHPPFGHVAEDELNSCVAGKNPDGYEGNAQSFRIVARLAARRPPHRGLNLTRATLNAILKYPWLRNDGPPEKAKKFGAYRTEREEFLFAREGSIPIKQSIEASIMDHADAVAYSVHDLDDFYRAGLVPLEDIHVGFSEQLQSFRASGKVDEELIDKYADDVRKWFNLFPRGRYSGDYVQRTALRALNSRLIEDFVSEVHLTFHAGDAELVVPEKREVQIRFLQNLVWTHVIMSPRLATQQHGQRRIIRTLYESYRDAILDPKEARRLVPGAFQIELKHLDDPPTHGATSREQRVTRLAADIVASFSDSQAVTVFRRLTGTAPGSVTDLIDA